jgi:two-component system, OmpR family, sensor histidine kinase MtrB
MSASTPAERSPAEPSAATRSPGVPVGAWATADAAVRRTLNRTRRLLAFAVAWLRHRWRRSLQFRVVAVTMVLGTLVLAGVGSYLYQRVANGLAEDRRVTASAEGGLLASRTQQQFDNTDKVLTPDALLESARNFVQDAAGTERSRYVILIRGENNTTTQGDVLPPIRSGEVDADAIPEELQRRVADNPSVQQMQIVPVKITGEADPVPSWIVGQQVAVPAAGDYGLYFVYPMTRERDTLALVGRFLLLGGVALMLMLGGIAYVVTRLVVAPVRRAADVAQRFASGALGERMTAKGEDDLAVLATSFNEMAASIQQQIAQMENLSRFQQRFVSDVSHELRTPLTTIRMAGDLIHDSRSDFDPAVARSAELLHNELDRFEALLSDLLEISRFDAGAAVLDVEPSDIRATVARVIESTAALAERKGVQITVEAPDEPCEAEIDSRRVERILRNLLVNGIEHSESRPVVVRVAKDDHAVAVSVRDHGIGLRPGEAAMVFNRFWRADPARARTTGGTGLGLAISLEDARLHNGWLQAWGAPGEGSCFRLTLPRNSGTGLESSPLPLNPVLGDVLPTRPAAAGMPTRTPGGEAETAILRRVRAAADPVGLAEERAAGDGEHPATAGVRGHS